MNPNITITKDSHKFEFFVKENTKGQFHKYEVIIKQTTDMSDFDMEYSIITYKCACPNSQTEHSAIHHAGAKYLKDWNNKARLGKDNPID